MKNDKICINKSVMFISAVLVILLGVVLATNYINNQKLSTKSRASFDGSNRLTGVPTLPLILSELKTKATATIQSLENEIKNTVNQSNVADLVVHKNAISVDVTSAEKAMADLKSEVGGLEPLLANAKKNLQAELTNTQSSDVLSTANKNVERAKENLDIVRADYSIKQEELNKKVINLTSSKAAVEAEKIFMNTTVLTLINSSGNDYMGIMAKLQAAMDSTSTELYISILQDLNTVVSYAPIFNSVQKAAFSNNLDTMVRLQAKYKSDQVEVSDLESVLTSLKVIVQQSEVNLQTAEKELNDISNGANTSTNKSQVISDLVNTIVAYETLLKSPAGSPSDTNDLPADFGFVTIPSPDYGVNMDDVAAVNLKIRKINTALSTARTDFKNLSDRIGQGVLAKKSLLNNDEKYCQNISPAGVYHAVLAYDKKGNLIGEGETPEFVKNYYTKYCKPNEEKPLWNGVFGGGAKCYKTIGICSSKNKAIDRGDIVNVGPNEEGTPQMCINREVDLQECVAKRTAPNSIAESVQECKKYGVFGWVGLSSYSIIHDVTTYLGAQVAPTAEPDNGLSNACVLLRPSTGGTSGNPAEPCFAISPRYCQYQDDGYVAGSVNIDGVGTYVDKDDSSKTWTAPGFDSNY